MVLRDNSGDRSLSLHRWREAVGGGRGKGDFSHDPGVVGGMGKEHFPCGFTVSWNMVLDVTPSE